MKYWGELGDSLEQGEIAPVYLFYGEETYLRDRAVLRFREHFLKDDEAGLNCDLIDGDTAKAEEIVARAETLPFFAEKRLVVVKNPSFFKNKRTASSGAAAAKEEKNAGREESLLRYLENPLASTCLILTTAETVDKRKKIFRSIKKNGRVMEFSFLKKRDLSRWLKQKAAAAGKQFEEQAAELFLQSAGPALQNLVLELDKLCSYTQGRADITSADVRLVTTLGLEDNIFNVVDAIGGKRCGEALVGIKEMLAAKEPPLRLLAMICRQFRLLLQVHDLTARGVPAREIPARLKIHPYVYQKIAAQHHNFEQALLLEAFTVLSKLEMDVKAGRQEFYPALETYLLKLCM